MKIKFLGAAREVTGSKHLIVTKEGIRILLDCGMFQGKGLETDTMNRHLGFNPGEIDYLVLTHAHIDHTGLIPYMYKLGFRGTVICTHATRDLCAIMLADCGKIQEQDTKWFNKKRVKQGKEPVEAIYTRVDADQCMELFIGIPYNRPFKMNGHVTLTFTNTGHLLGSGVANFVFDEGDRKIRLSYTGDVGRQSNRILRPPVPFPQADIIITESTYGNRLHEVTKIAEEKLLDVIKKTCIEKNGKLIIPSFSVGRTQEVIYSLNNFFNEGKLPKINIYVDSPLSVNATNIFRLHKECFNDLMLEKMEADPDPFGFDRLYFVTSVEESKRLNDTKEPCVIISASGMMEAGRVKHHLANSIADRKNTVLAVGYCAPSTLGAKILRGEPRVSIFGNEYPVNAEIEKLDSYSGHADYQELLNFLDCQNKSEVQMVYVVHGEYEAQQFFKEELEKAGFTNVSIPEMGEEVNY
jgi:metallo-beta-lactamase family protein